MTVDIAEERSSCVELVAFPQLLDLETYCPNTLKYVPRAVLQEGGKTDHPALEDWINIFRNSITSFQRTAMADPSRPEAERLKGAQQFAATYLAIVNEMEQQALQAGSTAKDGDVDAAAAPYGCLELCCIREEALHAAGFHDIFLPIKTKENAAALELLADVCAELDQHSDQRDRWAEIIRGVATGNIFDLGCQATTEAYHKDGLDFRSTKQKLVPRPWVIDDLDALLDRLISHCYKKAVLFVDNSGADVILGMLPLARELLRQGTAVILAANEHASINDITAVELEALLPQICAADPTLCKGVSTRQLQVVSSGSGLPVIDLSKVSTELAEAAKDADLVICEGMGRGVETNLHARFACDALNLAMIKHPEVAAALGGRLYDIVCQFRPAA